MLSSYAKNSMFTQILSNSCTSKRQPQAEDTRHSQAVLVVFLLLQLELRHMVTLVL